MGMLGQLPPGTVSPEHHGVALRAAGTVWHSCHGNGWTSGKSDARTVLPGPPTLASP